MNRKTLGELVSIVIPTHNRYESLIRAVDSCIIQTYQNIEILIIDDNYSNIKLREKIISKFKNYDSRIKLILNNSDLGASKARNIGITESNGKYISFLDDDDEYMADRILKMMDCFQRTKIDNVAMIYSYGTIVYPTGKKEQEMTDCVGNPLFIQMIHNIAGTSFWLCKKEVLEKINGFEDIYSHQDGIVLLKLLAQGYQIDLVRDFLVNYYAHDKGSGITGVNNKSIIADAKYYDKCKGYFHLLSSSETKIVTEMYYCTRIKRLLLIKDSTQALKEIREAWDTRIFSLYLFIKYILLYCCRSFYCLYDDYIQLKLRK
ncbi:glycosyltransferase family 2 protein [Streptococcus mitis]|uniref:glycosyltransferase family 2 protein n=1 Tax=Streptococcus mitis TaxID=28037 RepID=UPI0019343321|nr:glycosyltransferase family 2 protein [Streptococcus mitis]